ncbi:MAG: hypothetical protein KDA57_09330 [Planctomycetales bacterium]|nr:hypothetical protein [Planctomycetales bacterium]
MSIFKTRAAALVGCLLLIGTQSVQAQMQRQYQTANMNGSSASLASYNSFDPSGYDGGSCASCNYGDCNSCNQCCPTDCCEGGGSLFGAGICARPGQFFLVGEYIYARASLSEALAYVVSDPNAQPGADNIIPGDRYVEFDFGYQSSYRFSGGYRFCDCGGEIVFNFARYQSDASFSVQDTSTSPNPTIFSPYEVDAPGNAGVLVGSANVDLKSYDLGIAKTIPLGSPLGCCDTCCDDCCGGCDSCCCWCPAWDLTWSAGLRYADVEWARSTLATTSAADQIDTATTRLNFDGIGARVGVLGRRYIGRRGLMSVYAKGDFSLLAGDMNIDTIVTDDPDGTTPSSVRSHSNTGNRIIPVTEIEAGGTVYLGNHVQLSSGYFLSAWHDLGFRDTYDFGNQLSHYDDANILGFDGFFARAEITY